MKKFLFVVLLAAASITAYAQPRAIGANLGASLGFSYQHGFGESNMLDIAAYTPIASGRAAIWGLGATITYDWIDPFGATVPWNEKGEWHWYMGVGGDGGYFFPSNYYGTAGMGWVGAAGHFGIEYDFWFPFQLSLDWRPSIGVGLANNGAGGINAGFNTAGLYHGITLGVRYKF